MYKIIYLKKNKEYIEPYPTLTWLTNCGQNNLATLYGIGCSPLFVCRPKPSLKFSSSALSKMGIIGIYRLNDYDKKFIDFLVL